MRYLTLIATAALVAFWVFSGAGCRYHRCMGVEGYFSPLAKFHCTWRALRP